ncbi:MAG: bifunctional proline dehydrogenase/L-glutamate gamma-semialdehyde dehydrogenase PutA [Alphaproteobacteria bacterium]|nr:bifunctional proline dehydrogenase/L-glutamate gamma-semialdehyde dehydrogenase PutA [Alphaproteobacteria bacterium]
MTHSASIHPLHDDKSDAHSLDTLRARIRAHHRLAQDDVLAQLRAESPLDDDVRRHAVDRAVGWIDRIRADDRTNIMEVFLAEYGLSTEEGVALMCLAEALLRVPDAATMDALIEDKIAPSAWGAHLGQSSSSLVNASTWALLLTGKVLEDAAPDSMAGLLRQAVRRVGEPVIRQAVRTAMKELGRQFVLGETIEGAMDRARRKEAEGFAYSYDMLGEAALTNADADAYHSAYASAIGAIGKASAAVEVAGNPGISIKLSALHPRYERAQRDRVLAELTPRVIGLAVQSRAAGIGLNVDAEEADRLDLSLDIIQAVAASPALAGWRGFGVVVQAYGKRAGPVIDWLYALAVSLDRRFMVRLVKGAYWDTEIKRAQVDGVADFPVFTDKAATDVSYLCCAHKLLRVTDRLYPQFATHNAHTVAAVLEMAHALEGRKDALRDRFEFQRLHGMGEALHDLVHRDEGTRCRIYAPVGAHRDLLAYLVRRLLENGANSSFVNQIVDPAVPAETVARDPFETAGSESLVITSPPRLFGPTRNNARGWDLGNEDDLAALDRARSDHKSTEWSAASLTATTVKRAPKTPLRNPADPADWVGSVTPCPTEAIPAVIDAAQPWRVAARKRAEILRQAATLYEQAHGTLFAVLAREAGKTPLDAVAELREAVDFLRYYASEAERLPADRDPAGRFACISPWNFPLAIFTGQVAAALAAGNAVIAKPAEQTPLTAYLAVQLLHQAGVPIDALQLVLGDGATVGAALSGDPRIDGVCFTGSTETARRINRAMAQNLAPSAPLIAETGGINAMIVDSTALPEQAVRDIITSAFQSAGQRCSALRVLYLQRDIAESFLTMLTGAMDGLTLGDPWDLATDIGPVIDAPARDKIQQHIDSAKAEGRLLHHLPAPSGGTFVGPSLIRIDGIADLEEEIFGPVLHVALFDARELDAVIDAVNASGYGLTFGLHTRIDDRVERVTRRVKAGNLYINRNQIGAIVGSQPFGGEGLSGTGPKAGGPNYVARFLAPVVKQSSGTVSDIAIIKPENVQAALDGFSDPDQAALETQDLPGPTGESNRLSIFPRGPALCLGPTAEDAAAQAALAAHAGCPALEVAPGAALNGVLKPEALATLRGFTAVLSWGAEPELRAIRRALADRTGPILPLITGGEEGISALHLERHVCIDTTAAGGNASLLAASA